MEASAPAPRRRSGGRHRQVRVSDWCRRFARETTPGLRGADRKSAIVELETELPNVLAVLSWALTQRRTEMALLLLRDWDEYWWNTNRCQEGRAWIETALEQATDATDCARAGALLRRARLADLHYRSTQIREDYEVSLRLFRACHDAAGAAACLAHLVWVELWRGNRTSELVGSMCWTLMRRAARAG